MGSISKLIGELIKSLGIYDYISEKLQKGPMADAQTNMDLWSEVYAILDEIKEKTSFQRAMVFAYLYDQSTDLGEVSCMAEKVRAPYKHEMHLYQEYEIDIEYSEMIGKIITQKSFPIHVDRMTDSKLKDIYLTNKTRYSLVFYIYKGKVLDSNGVKKNAIYYGSFASTYGFDEYGDRGKINSPGTRVAVGIAMSGLAKIFKKSV